MGSRNRRNQRQQTRQDLARRAQQQPRTAVDPTTIVQQQVQQFQHWQGPIPPPEDLARYKEVDPQLPNQIVRMAERTLELTQRQTEHRIDMERRSILGMNWRANAGLWLAFLLSLAVLGAATFLIYVGHDAAGATMAGIDLVGLASVFVYGRYDQRRQENARTQ